MPAADVAWLLVQRPATAALVAPHELGWASCVRSSSAFRCTVASMPYRVAVGFGGRQDTRVFVRVIVKGRRIVGVYVEGGIA